MSSFDPRAYDAEKYELTNLATAGQPGFTAGVPRVLSRTDVLQLLRRLRARLPQREREEPMRYLEMLFLDQRTCVRAWVDGRWVPASLWDLQQAKKEPGRPRSGANGKLARAHKMREHENYENRDVAKTVYKELFAVSPAEALVRASQAASKGRPSCAECGKNANS